MVVGVKLELFPEIHGSGGERSGGVGVGNPPDQKIPRVPPHTPNFTREGSVKKKRVPAQKIYLEYNHGRKVADQASPGPPQYKQRTRKGGDSQRQTGAARDHQGRPGWPGAGGPRTPADIEMYTPAASPDASPADHGRQDPAAAAPPAPPAPQNATATHPAQVQGTGGHTARAPARGNPPARKARSPTSESKDEAEEGETHPPCEMSYRTKPQVRYPLDLSALKRSKKFWWEYTWVEDTCEKCLPRPGGRILVKAIQNAGTGEGADQLWVRRCLLCGWREEVDNNGKIPMTKVAQTQTGDNTIRRNTVSEPFVCHAWE